MRCRQGGSLLTTSFVVYYDVSNNSAKNLLNSPGIEVKDAVLSSSRLCSGVSARSSYLGEVGNGDDTPLLPSVVVISPIFTKERKAMLTLCLPLSDVAILP